MKDKYNTMIYPFDIESMPLIRHNNMIERYRFKYLVAPNGWGLTGKDASCTDEGPKIGIKVDNDFDKVLEKCDTVFFNKSSEELDFYKSIYPKMIRSAENAKNILCNIKLDSKVIKELTSKCNKNGKKFRYLCNELIDFKYPSIEHIHSFDTPIIFVIGAFERTNKFEIQLSLREKFIEMGYKVAQVGTRNNCELVGFHSFPEFMMNKSFDETQKIVMFNHYIKKIEKEEQPDVIIIGIPGGTIPITDIHINRFGILAYEIYNAVSPDAVVLSILYDNNLSKDKIEQIAKIHEDRFGYNIDCINIGNVILNKDFDLFINLTKFIPIDWELIDKKVEVYNSISKPIFNILNSKDKEKMSDFLVDLLAEDSGDKNINYNIDII